MEEDFADTDRLIEERVGNSIQGFVMVNGWEEFREVEREIVADISFKDNMIISTGGGVVTVAENVANLRRNGWADLAPRGSKDHHGTNEKG